MLFAIAWRNLWRNKRRTIITMSTVSGGLIMMMLAAGFVHAMGDRVLEAMTGSFLGHAQIHQEGYRTKRGAGLTVTNADRVLEAVRATKGVDAATGRIYGLAHASIVRSEDDEEVRRGGGADVASPVVAILGIDPEHEKRVTDFATHITDGRWLEGETEVVVGTGLAKRNGIEVGDAFLPTSVDSSGAMRGPWAASEEVPRVVGIVQTGMEDFDKQTVFVNRRYIAKLLRMEGEIHEVAIRADSAIYPDMLKLDPFIEDLRIQVAQSRSSAENIEDLPATRPLTILPEKAGIAVIPIAAPDAGSTAATPEPPTQLRLVGVEINDSGTEEISTSKLLQGRFLTRADEIVLTESIASSLSAEVGERVVVEVPVDCGPDVPAEACPPSAESFAVAGIISTDETLLQGRFGMVYSTVITSNIGDLDGSVLDDLSGDDAQRMATLSQQMRGQVQVGDEVMSWYELAPEILGMLAMMDAAPLFFLFIIFLAVGIGIVNTMLMATFERTRELGLMMALGLRPSHVVALVLTESAFLGLLGVATGLALGSAIVGYWSAYGMNMGVFMDGEGGFSFSGVTFDPVLWPRLTLDDLLKAGIPVFIMTTLAGLWPAIRAARLNATEALRQD